jgi:uncharacterized protein YrrD
MRTASSIQNEPIVDVSNGTKLGVVDRLIISPDTGQLVGLVAKSGGLFDGKQRIVDNGDIRSIGADAVTIRNGDSVVPEEEAPQQIQDVLHDVRQFLGTRVVTQDGTSLGKIDDVAIDEANRKLAALIVGKSLLSSGDAIPATRLVSVGPDVVVVRSGSPGDSSGDSSGDREGVGEP